MVIWKKTILDPQSSSAQIFGGDVVNGLVQYLSNTDLGAGDPLGEVQIATKTTYNSGKLFLFDSAGDHTVQFQLPNFSENKTLSVPSTMASTDDLVMRTTVQTITGKNIDSTANTLTNIGDASIAAHTSTKISITAKPQLNSTIVYLTDAQTLTTKVINVDANTIKHSTTNAAGDILESNGTSYQRLARGTAGQVLVSTASDIAWQTTNQYLPDLTNAGTNYGLWSGGAREGTGMFSGCALLNSPSFSTFQGSSTSWQPTTEFVTGTTTAIVGGFQGFQPTSGGWYTTRNQNFRFKIKLQFDTLTDKRFFAGLVGVNSLTTGDDIYIGTAVAGFGFRFSSTTDTTWQVLRNDTAGAAVVVNSGVTVAANTPHTLEIIADEANSRIGWSIDGSAVTYYATDIPANVNPLNYFVHLGSKTAVAQKVRVHYAYLTQAGS